MLSNFSIFFFVAILLFAYFANEQSMLLYELTVSIVDKQWFEAVLLLETELISVVFCSAMKLTQ